LSKPAPLTKPDGQVRELTAADLKQFRGADSLPASLKRKLGVRGQQKAPTKERVTTRPSSRAHLQK
jgi:hypothetical protein